MTSLVVIKSAMMSSVTVNCYYSYLTIMTYVIGMVNTGTAKTANTATFIYWNNGAIYRVAQTSRPPTVHFCQLMTDSHTVLLVHSVGNL